MDPVYSQRIKLSQSTEVYKYDLIPEELRNQVILIWGEKIGDIVDTRNNPHIASIYEAIVRDLRKAHGKLHLAEDKYGKYLSWEEELKKYFLSNLSVERALDVIEISFIWLNIFLKNHQLCFNQNGNELAYEANQELNTWFKHHNVGYRFELNKIIRIDSDYCYEEIIRPALVLLSQTNFIGAQDEFLKALKHYKNSSFKEAAFEFLKSFESIMKAICTKRKWEFDEKATVSPLMRICIRNGLIPSFSQSRFESLFALLESGLPPLCNNYARHGQGEKIVSLPHPLATYAMHETAALLVLFDQCDKLLDASSQEDVKILNEEV